MGKYYKNCLYHNANLMNAISQKKKNLMNAGDDSQSYVLTTTTGISVVFMLFLHAKFNFHAYFVITLFHLFDHLLLFRVGYRWITRFLALGCYAFLLFPGFVQGMQHSEICCMNHIMHQSPISL